MQKKYSVYRCSVCGYEYRIGQVRTCKHPAVNRKYGSTVCCWCCKKCKCAEQPKFIFGTICTYGKGKDDNQ